MTLAEPARTSAYSADIAIRVVWQRLGMGMTFRDIAERLHLGLGSAHRLYRRFIETGNLEKAERSSIREILHSRHTCRQIQHSALPRAVFSFLTRPKCNISRMHKRNWCFYWFIVYAVSAEARVAV